MPKPREVFEDPDSHWAFLIASRDEDFEGQHFDRKQAGQNGATADVLRKQVQEVIDQVKKCVSAFANANRDGGLLVLGIASNGTVKGINHLNEAQRNSLANINVLLKNHAAETRLHACTDENGQPNQLLLIYSSYVERALCETPGRIPEAWMRSSAQNVPFTEQTRDRLRRLKKIVDYENTYCCDFNPADIDQDSYPTFRQRALLTGVVYSRRTSPGRKDGL